MAAPILAVSVALAAGALACAGAPVGPAWETGECDGAPCVISHRPSWPEGGGWQVEVEPRLVIDAVAADGTLLFSDVAGARRLEDGRIGVADRRSSQVIVFSAAGQIESVIGGRGEGPDEFRRILWFSHCAPGSFHVLDLARRLATLDPGGMVTAAVDLGAVLEQASQRPACDTAGSLAGLAGVGGPLISSEPLLVRSRGVAKAVVGGGPVRVLGDYPIREFLIGVGDGRPHPLGRHTELAVGGGRVYVGTGDRFEVDLYGDDGQLLRRQSRPYDDLALTSAHLDALIQHELPLLADREQELLLRHIRAGNNPESLPAYDALQLDPTGALWAHHFRLPGTSANTWSVFDPDGVWLGEVQLPERFDVTEIGADDVLGVQRDALDEAAVAVYPLRRAG